ncbi:methyl-accepting chemotaxis protein [Oscillibacter sp.]|uniref:methyl-accepting chemotaxis protein n=1 Tax=Oscillibacter sp. TaxID=1945593 RepID=UPI0028A9E380|nr:methyl-accepting chemotaxis protein [Oscillibacter sp.]
MFKKFISSLQVRLSIIILLFSLCPLILVSAIFINSTAQTILSEQKSASNRQLEMFNNSIDSIFADLLNNVSEFANEAIVKQADSTLTSYVNSNGNIKMAPSQNGDVEKAIYQRFKEFGETHLNYQYVYMGTESGGYIQYPEGNMDGPYDPRQRSWYPNAMKNPDKAVLGAPYYFATDDIVIIGGSQALKDQSGKIIGVVALDMSLDKITQLVKQAGTDVKGYFTIIDDSGTIIADPSNDANNFKSVEEVYGIGVSTLISSGADYNETEINNKTYLIKSIKSEDTGWSYVALLDKGSLLTPVRNLISLAITIISIISISAVLIGVFISRKISKPIKEVSQVALKVANGDFYVNIKTKASGEVGELIDAFKRIGITLVEYKEYIQEISQILNSIADGKMYFELKQKYIGEFSKIKDSLLNISDNLSATIQNVKSSSVQIALASNQVSAGAQALAQGATEQASSIEELSASIIEISTRINNTANNAELAHTEAISTDEAVIDSNNQMEKMKTAMNNINAKSAEIGRIIKTIDDIAFQTNILALNAAVEAARAGSAGKGFAVVADEVRNLAQKSAEAAKTTSDLIEETVQAVEQGAKIVDGNAQSMKNVVEGSKKVQAFVKEIAQASKEQSEAVSQITIGVDQISSVIQNNSATAEESAAASEELSSQAKMLQDHMEQFQLRKGQIDHLSESMREDIIDSSKNPASAGNKY